MALNGALGVNAAVWVDRMVGLRNASMFVGVTARRDNDPPVCSQRLTDTRGCVAGTAFRRWLNGLNFSVIARCRRWTVKKVTTCRQSNASELVRRGRYQSTG